MTSGEQIESGAHIKAAGRRVTVPGHGTEGDASMRDQRTDGLCECGCGTAIKQSQRFVNGHNRRQPVHYVVDENGCWIWRGASVGGGYGTIRRQGQTHRAHRFVYELLVGPIPEGLVIDHLCRNRACVNPKHLEPVTFKENILRGEGATARHARKSQCVHGHSFTPDNLGTNARGFRICKQCARERNERYRRKRKAKGVA